MALLAVIKSLVKESGRNNLVSSLSTFAETTDGLGARYWLNRAQRFLDRIQQTPQSDASYIEKPAAGVYTIKVAQCRSINELWATNSSGERVLIERVQLDNFRNYYYEDVAEYDQGFPEYYAIQAFRQAPSQQGTTPSSGEDDYQDLYVGASDTYQGVIFMPPSDGTISYRIKGKFYSKALSADTDTTYWTEEHPELLVLVAKWFLEGNYKNENGLKSLMAIIQPLLDAIEMDIIETESAGVTHMEG